VSLCLITAPALKVGIFRVRRHAGRVAMTDPGTARACPRDRRLRGADALQRFSNFIQRDPFGDARLDSATAQQSEQAHRKCPAHRQIGGCDRNGPSVATDELGLVTPNLQHAEDHMLLLGPKTAAERVAAFLLEMDKRMPAPSTMILPMNRRDIAAPKPTRRNLALGGSDIPHRLPISENDHWYGDAATYEEQPILRHVQKNGGTAADQ
jgi:hypothetical protein